MALNDSLPIMYKKPCQRERNNSIESVWLSPSDFGECYVQPSDSQFYPCLTPVYNGKILSLQTDLVHASLSGISIKHYYGKCFKELEEEEFYLENNFELNGSDIFDHEETTPSMSPAPKTSLKNTEESATNSSFEYREDSIEGESLKPICVQYKINFRNSFWNIHRPELCKLTWPQKYVSAATITEHLHEHLTSHGALCANYHKEQDRIDMLNKELDEFVRLKEILSPRELPPDENFISFKINENEFSKALFENPRCKSFATMEKKPINNYKERFVSLSDDEDVNGKNIHRSKEEFCLTIGKHIRKPAITVPEYSAEEELIIPEIPSTAEEEAGGPFCFDWYLYHTEQSYEQATDKSSSEEGFDSESASMVDPCPPLKIDDFCRAVGKADFSDLRCNPATYNF